MTDQLYAVTSLTKESIPAAKTAFARDNFYQLVGDLLGKLLDGIELRGLLSTETGCEIFPLITFFQFLEGLTDTQTIDGIQMRDDWKFALHLPSNLPPLHEGALCKLRQRFWGDPQRQHEFQILIHRLVSLDPSAINNIQEYKVSELLSGVCSINCQSQIREAMRDALEILALRDPEWSQKIPLPYWYEHYQQPASVYSAATTFPSQEVSTQEIDSDMFHLLEELHFSGTHEISKVVESEIRVLDHIWRWQLEKFRQAPNAECEFLNMKSCDFCIHKDRRNSDGKLH
jgi:hypothetical protein